VVLLVIFLVDNSTLKTFELALVCWLWSRKSIRKSAQ